MSGKLVLVTGATGFIAGHVIEQALDAGYRVRGTARAGKLQSLQALHVPNLKFVQVDDIAKDDLTKALKDVDIVIHVAAPLPGAASIDDTVNTALEGTLNIVRQAEKAGIKKLIVTTTFGNVMDPTLFPGFAGLTLNDSQWGETTKEEIYKRAENPFYTYFAAKNLGEKALWDFVRAHPHLDVATVLPGFVYGPYSKVLPKPKSLQELGTNTFAYNVLKGVSYPPVAPPFVVDARDVARAHILVINLPPSSDIGSKRFLVNAGNFTWKQTAEHYKQVFPSENVLALDGFQDLPGTPSVLDSTKAKEVLGLKQFVEPKKTMEDAAKDLLELAKKW
ncbi:unnamed protein product [Cyclocybe aegerita]|uniref:NAD-dependent epimerase/dehydratase domain-containing protein n=1 Tax=Cyclocybe aegerita TaxID=1973307 RepID=A0A8S0WPS4_CYCAE|nr:unnamed protein product [Cyclocybe aegerita]